jgi:hypothetical protein
MKTKNDFWECKTKPSTVVDVWGEAELRVGEMKEKATVYERDGKLYIRRTAEFQAKFRKLPQS